MELLEKAELLNDLFSAYQELFTDKQREYFKMYYEMDYSLQEISDLIKVSRNAVYDQLKKVEENLFIYEEKLKLVSNRKRRIDLIKQYVKTKNDKYLDELKGMDE